MGPCIIKLKRQVMEVNEWHNNEPQDHHVSLFINKMQLGSLCIIYAFPYHHPTATMDHSIYKTDSNTLSAMKMDSSLNGFNLVHFNLLSSPTMQTDCCSSCPGGWFLTISEVKMLEVEVLGRCGYMWSAVVLLMSTSQKCLWRRLLVEN